MPAAFTLDIPGPPVGKARPRVYGRHAITPKKTLDAEARIFTEFRRAYPDAQPLDGEVLMFVEFWMPRQGKPDLDNLLKTVMDALNGVAYRDDAQITRLNAAKIMPDRRVPGSRPGSMRNRKAGDPCLRRGQPYEPHIHLEIHEY